MRIWLAHYTYDLNVALAELASENVDAVQWTDHADGRSLDQSVLRDDFFALARAVEKRKPAPAPKPKRQHKVLRKVKVAVKKVHPKVAAGGGVGAIALAVEQLLASHGAHLSSATDTAIVLVISVIAGVLAPSRQA